MNEPTATREGKIVTFYSYKGGTGRSMALANVAWVLATAGRRVLAIDWDLEAPGLHRYFEPFLADPTLEISTGVIDFVRDFASAAVAERGAEADDDKWYSKYANVLSHAVPVRYEFAAGGLLHLVPAGKQDAAYPLRVNSFDWHDFYERLGGGILLEEVKRNLRAVYDIILIDSRTGVSDTSGVCTIQMPDELVVCFTLNRQSIHGASAAARSAFRMRHGADGKPTLKVWPLMTRVEASEKERLEIAQTQARARFSGLMQQLSPEEEDRYWGEMPVAYEPYYAYEEVLAPFRDRPRQSGSMLHRMELLAACLNDGPLPRQVSTDEVRRAEGLAAYTMRSARDFEQEFAWLGEEYESLRARMAPGAVRTELMNLLVSRVQTLGGQRDAGAVAEQFFGRSTDGGRVVGLALARKDPQRGHIELAVSGIQGSRSPFEQFHALLLAEAMLTTLHPTAGAHLLKAIESAIAQGRISRSDASRWVIALRLQEKLAPFAAPETPVTTSEINAVLSGRLYRIADIRPSTRFVRYQDGDETHGPWVSTRGAHALQLPPELRLGRSLVTNLDFLQFVRSGGYEESKYWGKEGTDGRVNRRFVCLDGTFGPGHWPSALCMPPGKEDHPVTSISFFEANAYVNWCNEVDPESTAWRWSLPYEDHWEFAARGESGLLYPWGDAFETSSCNSAEDGSADTTPVNRYPQGASRSGCMDMAGNVWEYVVSLAPSTSCVLRGGSFKNDRFVVRSHLRLFGVPRTHRPQDFGFRLSQVTVPGPSASRKMAASAS